MNCYLCIQPAKYSCNCLTPIIMVCHEHLNIHEADTTKEHFINVLEDNETIIFIEIKDKLQKINDEIIMNSINEIKKIKKETKQLLCLNKRIMQNLYNKYLEKNLNKHFLGEIEASFISESDQNWIRSYHIVENELLINSTSNIRKDEYNNDQREDAGVHKVLCEDPKKKDVYEGEYKTYIKEGSGTCKYANGDVYEGDNKREGRGTYKFLSEGPNKGDIYEGEYKNDQREGAGTYKFANGEIYEGAYKNDQREGAGTFKFENGDIYEGT